jgi:hypothetical protein
MDKIIKYVIPGIAFFTLMCFFQTCGSKGISRDIKKQNIEFQSKIDSLTTVINSKPSTEEVEHTMEQVMYKYLIYEDDLDKGKISLSAIKNLIDE